MKYITFKKLTVKNFLSIGTEKVVINFKDGINCITGENLDNLGTRNGCGKSAVICAFNFAIFGDTLRPLTKAQIANNLINESTEVILEFNCNSPKGNNNFKIIRGLNPSICKVEKDGKDKTRDSIPNTTKYILEVLSGSTDIFKNCIIMRANNTIPFMAQGKVDKKRFIESIFNLDILTKMFKSVKDDISLQKRDLDVETKLITQIDKNLVSYKDKLEAQKESFNEQLKNIQKKENEYNIKINEIQLKINKNKEKLANFSNESDLSLDKLKNELIRYKDLLENAEEKFNNAVFEEKKLHLLINDIDKKGAICPECKRAYDKSDIEAAEKQKSEYINKLNDIQHKISMLSKLKAQLNENKKSLIEKIDNIRDTEYEYKVCKNNILRDEEYINTLQEASKNLNSNIITQNNSVLENLILDTEKDKLLKEEVIKKINAELANLDIARFILSEEGIRAYIIKKLLDLLNFRIKYYLSKLNSQYSLSFNELFEDEILNKRGIPVSYGNLSGAESKILDLSCIWAFRDILKLQGSVSYNVAFYDEILDSSLDSINSDIVCNVLNEFGNKEKQSIYIVSHKQEIMKSVTGEVIKLQKKNGITKQITF